MKNSFLFVVILIFIFVIELLLGATFAYFSSTKNINGTITLAELDFNVDCNFDENMQALPNSQVLSNFVLKNCKENGEYKNLIDFYFRFKLNAIANETEIIVEPIFNNENWFKNDEFYYYINVVKQNESVNICNNVLIDKNTGNNVQGHMMEVNIVFEAIQTDAVQDIWGDKILQKLTNF